MAQGAWDVLKDDFSSCELRYHQPLDVARSYLAQLGTTRYATMRRFRHEITEFVLEPTNATPEFQSHLWRYPVRHPLALDYLCVTPEEHGMLYSPGRLGPVTLPTLYGFPRRREDLRRVNRVLRKPPRGQPPAGGFRGRGAAGGTEF